MSTDTPHSPEEAKPGMPPVEAQPDETKAKAEPAATGQPQAGQEETGPAPQKPAKKGRGMLLDLFLVLLLLGILGTAAYYVHDTMTRYHVPTPMELAMEENRQLGERYEMLFEKSRAADEQIHLRKRLSQLDGQLSRITRESDSLRVAIDEHHSRVLALQYSIRQADATNRSVARNLLPGMRVGDVRTTDDDLYRNATIRTIDFRKKLISLRYPQGQVRFPIRELVKESLPDLARYALDDLDLVDMADFERSEGELPQPAKPARTRPVAKPRPTVTVAETDYETGGTPVLDTEANRTTTTHVPDEGTPAPAQDVWDAPTGDLPM